VIEILDEREPWEIPLPYTWEDHERLLEARPPHEDVVVGQWRYDEQSGFWADMDGARVLDYIEIVSLCMSVGWRLFSTPAPAALGRPENEGQD
jgi:hypothetical protein